jgi:hypothetical protein
LDVDIGGLGIELASMPNRTSIGIEVFYGTQYDMYDRLKKDSYVIEKDLYVRIWRLRLILYN